jgi:antitoxin (DNA-binding transcriptional repressor) of toxin-antitoxin stability system
MDALESITVGDLSKRMGPILDRVLRGERLLVCRHRRPIATLQPLNGVVLMPDGTTSDVHGDAIGDVSQEAAKLTETQRELLRDHIQLGRIVYGRLSSVDQARLREALDDFVAQGLADRRRGWGMQESDF